MSTPTSFEQLQLELINRFRTDPGGEYDRLVANGTGVTPDIDSAIRYFGVSLSALEAQLNALSAVAPLAWNDRLAVAAELHSEAQIDADAQSHQLPGGPGLGERVTDAGYVYSAVAENVFAFTDDALQGHAGFIIDWGYDDEDYSGSSLLPNWQQIGDGIQDPAGHRNNLINSRYTEIGIGAVAEADPGTSVGPYVVTQNLGNRRDYEAQFVGVVVDDLDGDQFYDIGEGLGGVRVTLTHTASQAQITTTTFASGGWQVEATPGTYSIVFSGGGLTRAIVRQATIGSDNVKVDAYQAATGDLAPVISLDEPRSISQDAAGPVIIGSIDVQDEDPDTVVLDLLGPNADKFEIVEGRILQTRAGAEFDFARADTVFLTVVAYDNFQNASEIPVEIELVAAEGEPSPGDDTITGGDGDDEIDGGEGNDIVRGGLGSDRYIVTEGDDRVVGTIEELVGDTIVDFGVGDSLFLMGEDVARDAVLLDRSAGLTFSFDANGNGVADAGEGPLTIDSSLLTGGDVMLSLVDGGTDVRYVEFLPTLGEGARVSGAAINGVANETYLTGDNRGNFTVTLQESGAGFDNSLGVYEVRANGTIADVRIISLNVKTDAGEVLEIGNVDAGSKLGFFLVQNGANVLPDGLDLDTLGIDTSSGTAVLTAGGSAVAGATIFVSHDASLNADGQEHVLSGVDDEDTGALRIGFEDLTRSGSGSDDDFQDVVFQVEAVSGVAVPLSSEVFTPLPQLDLIA